MLSSLGAMIGRARGEGWAVAAVNVYTIDGIVASIDAAEAVAAPLIVAVHPGALGEAGPPLLAAAVRAARSAAVPVGVHLDHASSRSTIEAAVAEGVTSVMADGSALDFDANVAFSAAVVANLGPTIAVEAELGRISGIEDGEVVRPDDARLTEPAGAARFVAATGVAALAVCVGNVHGPTPTPPALDFDRLAALARAVEVPLVLHGASGLPDATVRRAIAAGVAKFNVNTEVRAAGLQAWREVLADPAADLVDALRAARIAQRAVVRAKLALFGAAGRA
ncbi:MAG: class II fructose-bisphosphate aldolase [Acidimicrobiia bacterium]|nr:class II fructose-bisphosphate aldolase [Acidimicrobiia bacterium]